MANNIYIGNRYVPIFADPVEWDNLREYEALTIVTYNGTAYTSRKRVPVGTALSNTEYWVVTGNYNAQVEQYRQEVAAVSDNLNDVISNVSSLDTRVTSNTNQISLLSNRRYVLIGDSYSVGTTYTGTTNGWSYYFKSKSGLSDNDCYIFNAGGSGFVGGVDTDFLDLLNNNYENVTNRNTITDVIFEGGYNDGQILSTTLATAITNTINRAKELFPNATIWCGMFGYSTNVDSTKRNQLLGCAHTYWINTIGNGAKYIVNSELFLPSDPKWLMSQDNIHPTPLGYQIMGNAIYDAITTNGCMPVVPESPIDLDITFNNGITDNGFTSTVVISGTKKKLFFVGNTPGIFLATATSVSGGQYLTIGSISGALVGNNNFSYSEAPCRIVYRKSAGGFEGYNATLVATNGQLKLRFLDVAEGGGSGFRGVTDIDTIYFITKEFEFDSRMC